jgi:hypothetical protein
MGIYSTFSNCAIEVANLLEVLLHLLNFSYLFDHVLAPDTLFVELSNNVSREFPKLLRSEHKLR